MSAIVASLGALTFASPARGHREYRLEDIQCRCLTFRTNQRPSPCDFLDSGDFGWNLAQTLASQHDVPIQFAYQSTIDKVLSIPTPLPNKALQAVSVGDASGEANVNRNKIVCGFGKEVKQMSGYQDYEGEGHYVGQVIAWLMLLIILYSAGEYIWTK